MFPANKVQTGTLKVAIPMSTVPQRGGGPANGTFKSKSGVTGDGYAAHSHPASGKSMGYEPQHAKQEVFDLLRGMCREHLP